MGPIEFASLMLSRSMQRVELSAQNLANLTTPGFKAYKQFAALGGNTDSATPGKIGGDTSIDFSVGKLQNTGNPLDLAIAGDGFFALTSSDGATFYTRDGQFHRDSDGHLANPEGLLLQSQSGEAVVESNNIRVLADGTIVDRNSEPTGRIKIVNFEDMQVLQPVGGGLFSAPPTSAQDLDGGQIRQGMLESSNVSTADEMLEIMSAVRSAECGQRLVQTYDDLMSRVISTLGQT